MPFTRTRSAALASVLIIPALVAGCSAQPTVALTTETPAVASVPTGTVGAARFDDGYLQIGSGAKAVDLFIDPICPYCKLFEEASAQALFADAAAGKTTVRVHPVAILNRLSQGTSYSTRAAAVLTLVAATHPDRTQAFLQQLYKDQPAENSTGLTDAQLVSMAISVGADTQPTDTELAAYRAWVDQHTAAATTGPLTVTDEIPAIHQVPTAIVNGSVFTGNSDRTDAFTDFYRTH